VTLGLRLRHLTFQGPNRAPATVEFGPGLNVLYGASDTGKSFIVEAIDFMLGGKKPLRDLSEREGYDRILLAAESLSGEMFTLSRSTEGGGFRVYDGLYSDDLPAGDGRDLREQHQEGNDDNVSTFLLTKIGLDRKKIRRNQVGDVNNLSFRYLARLIIVNEEEIIQKITPLSDGNPTADTANVATFKLLLTGTDDSALIASRPSTPERQSRSAQLELLGQLIKDYRGKVKELAGPPAQLEEQLEKLDWAISRQSQQLSVTEGEYRELAKRRRDLLGRLDEGNSRLTEINSLSDRFGLLDEHYSSDIDRLRAIEEAGTLFSAMGTGSCPLCGAHAEHHRKADACEGDVEAIMAAARAEIAKIDLRQAELEQTISALTKEGEGFKRRLPAIESELAILAEKIEGILAPNLKQLRRSYGELADKRGEVKEALGLYTTLKDLEDRRTKLEAEDAVEGGNASSDAGLSASTVDRFAMLVLELLKAWHFPHVSRVHFDTKTKDLVIDGKQRVAYGKGLRAITYAGFVIGLLEYCRLFDTPHPGFVVLDSPLLSYREPDGVDDDLRGSDLNTCFYEYISGMADNRQVIIIENTDPPPNIQASVQALKFTGNTDIGRAGFFPPRDPLEKLLG